MPRRLSHRPEAVTAGVPIVKRAPSRHGVRHRASVWRDWSPISVSRHLSARRTHRLATTLRWPVDIPQAHYRWVVRRALTPGTAGTAAPRAERSGLRRRSSNHSCGYMAGFRLENPQHACESALARAIPSLRQSAEALFAASGQILSSSGFVGFLSRAVRTMAVSAAAHSHQRSQEREPAQTKLRPRGSEHPPRRSVARIGTRRRIRALENAR